MDDRQQRAVELEQALLNFDKALLRSLGERSRIAQELLKLRTGVARAAPVTGAAHLEALEKSYSLTPGAIRQVIFALDGTCRLAEVAPRAAFLGSEGSFGWLASRMQFGPEVELLRSDTLAGVLEDVARGRVDFAVVPYESMKDGPIFANIEAIAARDLRLVGEREVSQTLALVNRDGDPNHVERIFVSASDHAQCVQYLETNHPRAMVLDVRSPIMAWEQACEGEHSAAIIPSGLVPTTTLTLAHESVGDEGESRMRYGIVSRLPAPRSGLDATALLFAVHDKPGALHDILQHFKERSCNLRKIQSRPVRDGQSWQYLFYVEVTGHLTDRSIAAAMEGIRKEARSLKVVGSFPLEMKDPVTSDAPPSAR